MPFIFFILVIAGMYFLVMRPQQQRVRRQRELMTAIGVGDRVVTAGGLIGRVVDLADDRLLLEISDGVVVELLRLAISRRLDETEPGFEMTAAIVDDGLEQAFAEGDYVEEGDLAEEPAAVEAGPLEAPVAPATEIAPVAPVTPEPASPESPTPSSGAVGPDGSIEDAAAPAPRQDPH